MTSAALESRLVDLNPGRYKRRVLHHRAGRERPTEAKFDSRSGRSRHFRMQRVACIRRSSIADPRHLATLNDRASSHRRRCNIERYEPVMSAAIADLPIHRVRATGLAPSEAAKAGVLRRAAGRPVESDTRYPSAAECLADEFHAPVLSTALVLRPPVRLPSSNRFSRGWRTQGSPEFSRLRGSCPSVLSRRERSR